MKLTNEFITALSLYSLLGEEPRVTRECAKILGIKASYCKFVVVRMVKRGLIHSVKGARKAGLTRLGNQSDVYRSYGVPVGYPVKKLEPIKIACDLCGERKIITNEDRICEPCLISTEKAPSSERIARCGHPSSTRYFKCERCLHELGEDLPEFIY